MAKGKEAETARAMTFEAASVLRVLGFRYAGAENMGRRGALLFQGDGVAEALRRHEGEGVMVNSRAFSDGLSWAKSMVFSTRDSGGRGERP